MVKQANIPDQPGKRIENNTNIEDEQFEEAKSWLRLGSLNMALLASWAFVAFESECGVHHGGEDPWLGGGEAPLRDPNFWEAHQGHDHCKGFP